jgi:hypothetical protein
MVGASEALPSTTGATVGTSPRHGQIASQRPWNFFHATAPFPKLRRRTQQQSSLWISLTPFKIQHRLTLCHTWQRPTCGHPKIGRHFPPSHGTRQISEGADHTYTRRCSQGADSRHSCCTSKGGHHAPRPDILPTHSDPPPAHCDQVCHRYPLRSQANHTAKANAIIDEVIGASLEYQQLVTGAQPELWIQAYFANDLGMFTQGVGTRQPPGTNTIFCIQASA